MTPEHNDDLISFPCEFPIKVIGRGADLRDITSALVRRHVADLADDAISLRPSKNANFIAVTVTITATSRAQLDAIYLDLTAHEQVIMAL